MTGKYIIRAQERLAVFMRRRKAVRLQVRRWLQRLEGEMKPGMFQTYTDAIAYLVVGAITTGLIVWGMVEVIWLLR